MPLVDYQALKGSDLALTVDDAVADATNAGVSKLSVVTVTAQGRPEITVTSATEMESTLDTVQREGAQVVSVEPVQTVRIADNDGTPNDPLYPFQWSLATTHISDLWACSKGAGVDIAVVDTGVMQSHPEFGSRVTSGVSYLNLGAAVVGDGGVDPQGHGTWVAGIIAAEADNNIGIAGVAPLSQIIPIRALSATGISHDVDVARGITWAVDNGAEIVNLSLEISSPSGAVATAIDYARANNVVVFAAAGNNGTTTNAPVWPAADPDVIAVGSSMASGAIAPYSNRQPYVDIVAPGSDIRSTGTDGDYVYVEGTSMATPFAAGVAAILLSANPTLTPAQIYAVLTTTAEDRGTAGFDSTWGWGFIDPVRAAGL